MFRWVCSFVECFLDVCFLDEAPVYFRLFRFVVSVISLLDCIVQLCHSSRKLRVRWGGDII